MMRPHYRKSIEGYVMQKGKNFSLMPLTPAQEEKLNKALTILRPVYHKQCFWNSMQLWMIDNSFKYCEGYAQFIIPVHHAWNSIAGKVVDITTEYGRLSPGLKRAGFSEIKLGRSSRGSEYFGIQFSDIEVRRQLKINAKEGQVLSLIATKLFGPKAASVMFD